MARIIQRSAGSVTHLFGPGGDGPFAPLAMMRDTLLVTQTRNIDAIAGNAPGDLRAAMVLLR
jgi:hypothetical protein